MSTNKPPARVADYKIVLLGESSVGKSSIVERLQTNVFNDKKSSTIGAAFINKKIVMATVNDIPTKIVNLQIWDTAGQERFHNLTPLYYRNANLAIVVYDVSNFESLTKARYWITQLIDFADIKIVLVGNKIDLNKKIDEEELKRLENDYSYKILGKFQTSAKTGLGIKEMFEYITENVDDELYHSSNEGNRNGDLIDLNLNNAGDFQRDQCLC